MLETSMIETTAAGIGASTDWWEHLNLNRDPFIDYTSQEKPNVSQTLEEHLDLLLLLTRHSYELATVIGDVGSGKSTLIDLFLAQLQNSMPVCYLNGNSSLTVDDIFHSISVSFGLPQTYKTGANIRAQINVLLDSLIKQGERCLLIIDDGHLLNSQMLQTLLFLQSQRWEQQAPLAIVIAIEQEFEERFNQIAQAYLEKTMLKPIRLLPYALPETEAYLQYRLQQAGFKGGMPFTQEELEHIQQWSRGLPSRINSVAKKLLIEISEETENEESVSYWRQHQTRILSLAVLAMMFITGLYFWNMQHSFNRPYQYQPKFAEQQPITVAKANPVPQQSLQNDKVLTPQSSLETSPQVIKTATVSHPSVATSLSDSVVNVNSEPSPTIANPLPAARLAVFDIAKQNGKTLQRSVAQLTLATPRQVKPRQKLPAVPENGFTIQLVGLSSRNEAMQFLQREKLQGKAHYYQTKRSGKNWYVVVLGRYETKQVAKKAIQHLPQAVQKLKPWVRTYASIHKATKNV